MTATVINSTDAFESWLRDAKPGEACQYAEGCWLDRKERGAGFVYPASMRNTARVAYEAYLDGKVELAQKRVGENVFQYLAFKRQQVKPITSEKFLYSGKGENNFIERRIKTSLDR